MKNGKAAGEDGIGVEFLKALPRELKEMLRGAINEVWKKGELAKGWETARIIPIYKEGGQDKAENYRGISLLDVGYKVLSKMMTVRLSKWIEGNGKLKESQAGFRKGRGTRDQIFTLNAAINKKLKEKGGKLYVAFIDSRAAFDRVNRERLLEKLKRKGIGGRMLEMIKGIYKETRAEVQVGGRITENFRTKRGVRQGCALSAVLFDLYVDDLEDMWERRNEGGVVIGKEKIFAIKYADDVAAIAETAEGLRSVLKDLERWADGNRMEVNARKTKVMVFRNGGRVKDVGKWKFKGDEIQVVNNFKYLGYWFTSKNSCWLHGRKSVGKAQKAMNTVWGVWKRAGRDIIEERLYLLDSIVRAGVMYGVEVWGFGEIGLFERIQSRYCKMALGVKGTTPDYIWRRELGVPTMRYLVIERALRYMAEVLRMAERRWPRICLMEEIRGIRNNKPSRWGSDLGSALRSMGIQDVVEMIGERREVGVIVARMKEGLENLKNDALRGEEERMGRSTFCDKYRLIVENDSTPWKYWAEEGIRCGDKEIWARLRCGSIGRAGKKGEKDWMCRVCQEEEETLEHLMVCEESTRLVSESARRGVNEWRKGREEDTIKDEVIKMLRGGIQKDVCLFFKEIEKIWYEKGMELE
ncbi:hypothetical protein M0802_015052 [Mischocyttarus mexicanus]|nr:hypothetical protein M0802_015052 [Mischocyttarus mexicanus]